MCCSSISYGKCFANKILILTWLLRKVLLFFFFFSAVILQVMFTFNKIESFKWWWGNKSLYGDLDWQWIKANRSFWSEISAMRILKSCILRLCNSTCTEEGADPRAPVLCTVILLWQIYVCSHKACCISV